MRTNIFNKMTAGEIDAYLASGKDAIIIAVGVTEIHGEAPVDIEGIKAEGLAVALAEKSDALALVNLPFFYPGGTAIGNATIHTSIVEGYQYLWKILKSLVDQGFKKLFLVPGHSIINLILNPIVRDFFEATHIHPVIISPNAVLPVVRTNSGEPNMSLGETINCGAYRIMKLEEYLQVNPNAESGLGKKVPDDPRMLNFSVKAKAYGGVAELAYSDPLMHGGGLVFKSEEERAATCEKGEKMIREAVDKVDLEGLFKAVEDYQEYVQKVVLPKFPRFSKLP